MLTVSQLRDVLRYDPVTGNFVWLVSMGRARVGAIAGRLLDDGSKKYLQIGVHKKVYMAHRLAWFYMHGQWPDQIDHINGNGLDNSLPNLRNVSLDENRKNLRRMSRNSSGVTGVRWCKQSRRWKVYISTGAVKARHLGYFSDLTEACIVRWMAERDLGYHPNHGSDRPL